MKDWTGNSVTHIATNGFANIREYERDNLDYYATEPKALELLLELEDFNNVWECAAGGGHLVDVLERYGILGKSSDIITRGYRSLEQINFLEYRGQWHGDILTNPPYKYANQFIEQAMRLLQNERKLALFLPIRYLEGKARKKLFSQYPPKNVYVSSGRLKCAMNGDFESMKGSAVSYAWFVWEKGYEGETRLKWFN
jgi:hypothetical protein